MHLPLASTLLLSRADLINNRPDYSRDAIPPYPSMKEADGSDISVDNLRGTRLYGWKGCTSSDADAIAGAFDDFSKLAKLLGASIDWAGEIAEDFWGKNEGKHRVPDERRKQIQQIFQVQQQMYAIGWHVSPPYWTSLWIEVRCSGGDDSGDPDNICMDKKPNNGQCGRGGSPAGGNDNSLQAYSEPTSKNPALTYSRMTFCNKFFNMPSLGEAIASTPKKSAAVKGHLASWDNRARVFLHETTHLDYFMNAPGYSPLVDDLQFDWNENGQTVRDWAYGPFFCKMLRNYGQGDQVGFDPQRNADSFAWFALGSYIKQATSTYPRNPRPRGYPTEDPWNSNGRDVKSATANPADLAGQPPEAIVSESNEDANEFPDGFSTPHCPDNGIVTKAANSGTSSAKPPAIPAMNPPPPPGVFEPPAGPAASPPLPPGADANNQGPGGAAGGGGWKFVR